MQLHLRTVRHTTPLGRYAARVTAALLAASLAACAPGSYKAPVDRFAGATATARDAFRALEAEAVAAQVVRTKQEILRNEKQAGWATGTCLRTSTSCRIDVLDRSGATVPLVPPPSDLGAVLNGLVAYAGSLQAIMNADTSAKVGTSLSSTGSSLVSLNATLRKLNKSTAADPNPAALIQPAIGIFSSIATAAIEAMQVAALRQATMEADPIVRAAGEAAAEAAKGVSDSSHATLFTQARAALDAHRAQRGDAGRLDRVIQTAAGLDAQLAAGKSPVFANMADAHTKLTLALTGDSVSLAEVIAAIDHFAARAETLVEQIEAFRKAQDAFAKSAR